MARMIFDFTKKELENVSYDPHQFKRKLKKATKNLLPYEMDQLQNWLSYFIVNKPGLKKHVIEIKSFTNQEGVY